MSVKMRERPASDYVTDDDLVAALNDVNFMPCDGVDISIRFNESIHATEAAVRMDFILAGIELDQRMWIEYIDQDDGVIEITVISVEDAACIGSEQ